MTELLCSADRSSQHVGRGHKRECVIVGRRGDFRRTRGAKNFCPTLGPGDPADNPVGDARQDRPCVAPTIVHIADEVGES